MGNQITLKGSVHRKNAPQIPGEDQVDGEGGEYEQSQAHISRKKSRQNQTVALIKLFEKLELTADGDNAHPGELTKATFENAFQGPLHRFGKLMYLQMMSSGTTTNRERITREQFVKAGREILKMFDEKTVVKYYFYLFASSKEFMTKEDAKNMFEISFALTLSLSKILYQEDERDPRVFSAMVTGLFGINTEVGLDEFNKWLNESCPHLFHCVHNWVCQILTGSSLPVEMEMARVPHLEGHTAENNCTSMAILWLLSLTLPPIYTKQPGPVKPEGACNVTKDPMVTSMLLLRKIARLPEVQSWKLLYNSDNHGMSINRFNNHVSAYHAPTVSFFAFEGRNLYCLAIDRGWVEGPNRFGGADCRLIQLLPVYRVNQVGEKMVRWTEFSREIPKGITIGCEGKTQVLRLAEDFDKIFHYDVPCELHKIEVWGCGAETALKAQESQRKWEASAVRKEQSRKLRPEAYGESWNDNPDKQILQWGGVDVGNHSYNR
ncbi:restriction of telomere capping protein 5 [Biomphalaria glabrata]|nr:restriction of telomere capping protein 5 [Biomphalaria glabrata]